MKVVTKTRYTLRRCDCQAITKFENSPQFMRKKEEEEEKEEEGEEEEKTSHTHTHIDTPTQTHEHNEISHGVKESA